MRTLIPSASVCVAALVSLATLAAMTRTAAAGEPRFELQPQLGYAGTFTTGLSPYGAYVGLGVRARPAARLWLSTSLFSYAGAAARADGVGLTYRAHDHAYAVALDATWRFEVGRCALEPGVEGGAALVTGSTYVTPARISDLYIAANVGPVVRTTARIGRFAFGVEAAGLFIPSNVAAPVIRVGAVAVVPF